MIHVPHGRGLRCPQPPAWSAVKLLWFHLMPYPELPADFNRAHRSVWVDIDPALFDREVVADCYERYIDQLVHAEACGFDGVCINEHHSNGYGLVPSPNVIGAVIATRTSRAAITVLGNSVALYNPPVRVAEEMAMLDLLSRSSHQRLPGRHVDGHGLRLQRQPGHPACALPRGRRPRAQSVDGDGAVRLQRSLHTDALRQRRATTVAATAPTGVDPRRGLRRDVGLLRPERLRLRRPLVLRPSDGQRDRQRLLAPSRGQRQGPQPVPAGVPAVRRRGRHRSGGLPVVQGARRVLLQPFAARLSRLRRPARLRHRGVGTCPLPLAGARRREGQAGQARPHLGRDGGQGLRRHRQRRHRPRDARRRGHHVQLRPPADDAAVRQHERRAHSPQHRGLRRQGGPRPSWPVQRRRGPLVAGRAA